MFESVLVRATVEVVSAIICFILAKFMAKPYQLIREARFLGLPLGFVFLGLSYTLSSIAFSASISSVWQLSWLQLLIRTFAFVFLAVTYSFSKTPSKNARLWWGLTLSLAIFAFFILFMGLIIAPGFSISSYSAYQPYLRVFNVVCLSYIAIQSLKSHIKKPEPTTIWIPLGFILLGISQYSLLFFYTDRSLAAFDGAMITRLMAFAVFLSVTYRTFYGSRKKEE